MIGIIERLKNNVLLKCSTLNDEIISKTLNELIDTKVYRFAEEIFSMIGDLNVSITEETLRSKVEDNIKEPMLKKIKRKLFIDSLALQITNDSFIEDYVKGDINLEKLRKTYIKELNKNKSSNQLNMTEDLNLSEIINKLKIYIDEKIVPEIKENTTLVNSVTNMVTEFKKELENALKEMIENADLKYLSILTNVLEEEIIEKEEKGEEEMIESIPQKEIFNNSIISESNVVLDEKEKTNEFNKFDKYDDMTLFNKMILSLNTEEEKLSRKESKLEIGKKEVDQRLSNANKNIETNIERENKLSQRKLELNSKEVELNSKLSETEVIFLNMKPLIKGLNKIKDSSNEGGSENE